MFLYFLASPKKLVNYFRPKIPPAAPKPPSNPSILQPATPANPYPLQSHKTNLLKLALPCHSKVNSQDKSWAPKFPHWDLGCRKRQKNTEPDVCFKSALSGKLRLLLWSRCVFARRYLRQRERLKNNVGARRSSAAGTSETPQNKTDSSKQTYPFLTFFAASVSANWFGLIVCRATISTAVFGRDEMYFSVL